MTKENNNNFYRAIGNSIQENKDKIEKLEKQVDRLKKKNKQISNNWNELKEWLENRFVCPCEEEILDKMQEIESRK